MSLHHLTLLMCATGAVLLCGELPKAVVADALHDFGNVRRGETVTHAFTVRNSGQAPLTLLSPQAMSPGLRISFPPSVSPGAEGKVVFEWNTAAAKQNAIAEAKIGTNDPATTEMTFSLRAKVISPIEIRPMAAAFFSLFQGDKAEQVLTIRNNEDRPLRITRMTPEGSHFKAELREVTAGTMTELRITVPAGTEPGRFMEAVQIQTDHPSYPSVRIPVNVLVKTELYANPETVEFGNIPLNQLTAAPRSLEFLTQTFLVKVRQGAFELQSIESDVPGLKITQTPPTGASGVFRIDVALNKDQLARRSLNGSLRILTSHPGFPEIHVPIRGELQ